jgi:MYXO-CTERM domain-containing protein
MHAFNLSTLVKAGLLSVALTAGPLSAGVFAQATDQSRTPTETRTTGDTRDDDDGFDWGWLGLLGLIGLAGLRHRDEPRAYRETQTSHGRS